MMKRLTAVLAMMVILAACAGDSASDTFEEIGAGLDGGGEAAPVDAATETTTAAAERQEEGDDGLTDVDLALSQERKVIRNAQLQLRADDTREAYDAIVSIAEAAGGFVANATVYPVDGEDGQPEVAMVLRIPSDALSETMGRIKDTAQEVIAESQDAEDVTEQFVDLEARLTNLEALEVELRALLEEVRQQPDADPDKLLRVFSEISSVRGQIEQIQGQLNYLDDVVALASLEVSLTPTPAAVPIVEDTWRPVEAARDALRNLVAGLQNIADWAIGFGLYLLPMLILVAGLPGLALFLGFRWWRRRRPPATPTPSTT